MPAESELPFAGRHLVLMGLRASGKTTAGRLAARSLSIAFIDLDALVLRELDAPSVTRAWADLGERAFRAAETACLRDALMRDREDVLASPGDRPPLSDAHLPAEVRGVYEKRDSVYQALAEEVIEAGALAIEAVAERLAEIWRA